MNERIIAVNELISDFGEETSEAFEEYFTYHYRYEDFSPDNSEKTKSVRFHYSSMILNELIFENYKCENEPDCDLEFENCLIKKENGRYQLTSVTDCEEKTLFSFSSVRVKKTKLRDTDPSSFWSKPWDIIFNIASAISSRSNFELSEKERELYPLSCFITMLFNPFLYPAENNINEIKIGADMFSSLCEEFGFKDFYKYRLVLLSDAKPGKKAVTANKMLSELNNIKHKPLFDKIYSSLYNSQKDYPTLVQVCADKDELNKKREKITALLHLHGYEGEYPNFFKNGKLTNLRTVQSYDQLYTLTKNSPARFFISVIEIYDIDMEKLSFEFICATHIKRKKEVFADNVVDCLFFDKGHRIYDAFSDEALKEKVNAEDFMTHIAVKKAELMPLSKEEAKRLSTVAHSSVFVFAVVGIICGLLFGALFIPLMMLLTFIFDGRAGIEGVPWLKMGVGTGLFFGVSFSVVTGIIYQITQARR